MQAVWDILWGADSLFINTETLPVRAEKQANGKYKLIAKPSMTGSRGAEIEVTLCDSATGQTKTYLIVGREKPAAPPA